MNLAQAAPQRCTAGQSRAVYCRSTRPWCNRMTSLRADPSMISVRLFNGVSCQGLSGSAGSASATSCQPTMRTLRREGDRCRSVLDTTLPVGQIAVYILSVDEKTQISPGVELGHPMLHAQTRRSTSRRRDARLLAFTGQHSLHAAFSHAGEEREAHPDAASGPARSRPFPLQVDLVLGRPDLTSSPDRGAGAEYSQNREGVAGPRHPSTSPIPLSLSPSQHGYAASLRGSQAPERRSNGCYRIPASAMENSK